VDGCPQRDGSPKRDRDLLRHAFLKSALDPEAKVDVPIWYAVMEVAQSFGTHPSAWEDGDAVWLLRALEAQRLRASVKVKRGRS
jgi:hypothetical protein